MRERSSPDRYAGIIAATQSLRTGGIPAVAACLQAHGIDPHGCVLIACTPSQGEDIYAVMAPGPVVASVEVPRDGAPPVFSSERLHKGRRSREVDFAFRWVTTGRQPD